MRQKSAISRLVHCTRCHSLVLKNFVVHTISSSFVVFVDVFKFSTRVTSPGHASTRTVLPSGSTSIHQAVNKCNDLEWQRGIWKFARDTGGFTSKALRFFSKMWIPTWKIHQNPQKEDDFLWKKKCFEGVSWNTWKKTCLFFSGDKTSWLDDSDDHRVTCPVVLKRCLLIISWCVWKDLLPKLLQSTEVQIFLPKIHSWQFIAWNEDFWNICSKNSKDHKELWFFLRTYSNAVETIWTISKCLQRFEFRPRRFWSSQLPGLDISSSTPRRHSAGANVPRRYLSGFGMPRSEAKLGIKAMIVFSKLKQYRKFKKKKHLIESEWIWCMTKYTDSPPGEILAFHIASKIWNLEVHTGPQALAPKASELLKTNPGKLIRKPSEDRFSIYLWDQYIKSCIKSSLHDFNCQKLVHCHLLLAPFDLQMTRIEDHLSASDPNEVLPSITFNEKGLY